MLEKIYNDDKNFYSRSDVNESIFIPKNRAHNVNNTFSKYTPDELEKLLMDSQKGKFN